MQRLLKSAKFLTAVLDAALSTTIVILAWFLSPDQMDQALLLVGVWQPVFIAVIAGIAYEDGQLKRSGSLSDHGG